MIFDVDRIRQYIFPSQLEFFETVESTNSFALDSSQRLAGAAATLVLAEHQTQGRGRRERIWISRAGNLTFSFVFTSPKSLVSLGPDLSILPLVVAQALQQGLSNELKHEDGIVFVKWPNDLILCDRKLGGILCETRPVDCGTLICVGVGINVNAEVDIMEAKGHKTIGLSDVSQRTHDLTELICKLYGGLSRACANWVVHPVFEALAFSRIMYGVGKFAEVKNCDGVSRGTIIGANSNGELLLENLGQVKSFSAGSLRYVNA